LAIGHVSLIKKEIKRSITSGVKLFSFPILPLGPNIAALSSGTQLTCECAYECVCVWGEGGERESERDKGAGIVRREMNGTKEK
jgi:hypothetical protein